MHFLLPFLTDDFLGHPAWVWLAFVGIALVSQFSWVLYLFGAFLIFTGIKMWVIAAYMPDIANNPLLKFLKRHLRVTNGPRGNAFWVRETNPATGKLDRFATPLFLALVLVEFIDLIFALRKTRGQPAVADPHDAAHHAAAARRSRGLA